MSTRHADVRYDRGSMADVFEFGFMSLTIRASIDDATIEVKQGLRTFRVPLAEVRHLYVRPTGQFRELLVGTEPSPGKKKVFRFSANVGQGAFDAFVAAVVARRPDCDRRSLDAKTAMTMMGAKNVELITGLVLFGLLVGGLAIGMLPKLLHGIDGGHEKVKVEKLAGGYAPSTSNLTLTAGRAETIDTLSLTTVSKRNGIETGRSTKYYIPIVAKDADDDDPIKVVLVTPKLGPGALETLERASSFEVMARDVLWEGLSSTQREWFVKHAHRKLAKDALLVEYEAEPSSELLLFLGVVGGTSVLVGLLIGFVVYQQRKQQRATA